MAFYSSGIVSPSSISDPVILNEGDTQVTFTGLNSDNLYDLYFETADGTPVYITDYVDSGTSVTYTFKAITSAQAGSDGKGCTCVLKCCYR